MAVMLCLFNGVSTKLDPREGRGSVKRMMRRSKTIVIGLSFCLVAAFAGPAPAQAKGSLTWQPCPSEPGSKLECAKISVPLDHSRPRGRKIELALTRLPATDAAQRRGVLLANPGGP